MHKAADNGLFEDKPFAKRAPEPAAAGRIARDFGILSILPCAYYVLARILFDDG